MPRYAWKKAGDEVKLREKCPHLFDIDGDSCHLAHNAAKKFCKPFNSHFETLFQDIYNDFKWSLDLRTAFKEFCEILNIQCTVPQNYIGCRWLLNQPDKLDFLHEAVKVC
ncbi:hypothetical protein AVEN_35234-1 [Araneus ventricosus]|uniref:Uncharacterized protein n=1 Tax=Araneus ventricosus TaxID=182803 RepID=A0A4Y2UAT1_ARAVE|nr:hypothetical protein AVEN_35234-1 [Araneus ventricosus]